MRESGETECAAHLENKESHEIGGCGHVDNLEDGPFPPTGFAFDDGHSAEALHGKNIEDHESEADQGGIQGFAIGGSIAGFAGEFIAHLLAGGGFIIGFLDGINDRHCGDKDFPGGK